MLDFLYININIDPNIGSFGPFQITWHGVFTAIAIAVAVISIASFARFHRINEDWVYNTALWGVPAGIIGARLLYVIEHADTFKNDPASVFSVNEGGISVYGGLILGALVAFAYARRQHYPIRRLADAAALGLLLAQAIGRLGDTINGEHWAKASNLPWAFCYTNPNTLNGDPNTSTTAICGSLTKNPLSPPAVHPVAGLYEPLALLALFCVLYWLYRRLNVTGYVFWIYVLAYAAIRFALAPLRLNESKLGEISVPQVVSIGTVVLGIVALFVVHRMAKLHPEDATAMQPAAPPKSALAGTAPSARRGTT